jgi:hypothetical protein
VFRLHCSPSRFGCYDQARFSSENVGRLGIVDQEMKKLPEREPREQSGLSSLRLRG